jgi:hypothetical protein
MVPTKMSTYSNTDLEQIAETIGKSPGLVIKYANRFEAAATAYIAGRLNVFVSLKSLAGVDPQLRGVACTTGVSDWKPRLRQRAEQEPRLQQVLS